MQPKHYLIVGSLITSLVFHNISQANNTKTTYIGIGAIYSSTKLPPNFGGNVFSKKMLPGINLALGHMFNKHFGAEFGFEIDKTNKRTVNVNGKELVFEFDPEDPDLIYSSFSSKINQNHLYFGIKTKLNTAPNSFISMLLGASFSNFKLQANLFGEQIFDNLSNSEKFNYEHEHYIFNKKKFIPLIQLSFEHIYKDKYGIKIFYTWKKTSNFTFKEYMYNKTNVVKLKNTMNIGCVFSYYFL